MSELRRTCLSRSRQFRASHGVRRGWWRRRLAWRQRRTFGKGRGRRTRVICAHKTGIKPLIHEQHMQRWWAATGPSNVHRERLQDGAYGAKGQEAGQGVSEASGQPRGPSSGSTGPRAKGRLASPLARAVRLCFPPSARASHNVQQEIVRPRQDLPDW